MANGKMHTCRRVDRQRVKCGPYLWTRSAFYPRAMTTEIRFPVYKPAAYM